ncbi:MAG: hypothetical protein M9928_00970 [Anaerolineae bacterium]|nr:hypothetical protein [Anaerolineae bacterium]
MRFMQWKSITFLSALIALICLLAITLTVTAAPKLQRPVTVTLSSAEGLSFTLQTDAPDVDIDGIVTIAGLEERLNLPGVTGPAHLQHPHRSAAGSDRRHHRHSR